MFENDEKKYNTPNSFFKLSAAISSLFIGDKTGVAEKFSGIRVIFIKKSIFCQLKPLENANVGKYSICTRIFNNTITKERILL